MRISDWSSDVCSSDLCAEAWIETPRPLRIPAPQTVASCAEAWIETYLLMRSDDRRRSPPARRRGSKRLSEARGFLEARQEERREGKECVSTCRSRGSRYN